VRTPEGTPIPPNTLDELKHDMAHLRFISDQIDEVKARLARLQKAPKKEPHAIVRLLAARIYGLGIETAEMLAHEVFSRDLRDRRAMPGYAGLTGSPDESGERRRERGLARARNALVAARCASSRLMSLRFVDGANQRGPIDRARDRRRPHHHARFKA
jgi:transposase